MHPMGGGGGQEDDGVGFAVLPSGGLTASFHDNNHLQWIVLVCV